MKKFIVFLIAFFVIRLYATDTAEIIGNGLADHLLALNHLNQSKYCNLRTTLLNTELTNQQKADIIYADTTYEDLMNADQNLMNLMAIYDFESFLSVQGNAETVVVAIVRKMGSDLPLRPVGGGDPCAAARAALGSCGSTYKACLLAVAWQCGSECKANPICGAICFMLASIPLCDSPLSNCINAAAESYPGCIKSVAFHSFDGWYLNAGENSCD
jgi:hypothetical protein